MGARLAASALTVVTAAGCVSSTRTEPPRDSAPAVAAGSGVFGRIPEVVRDVEPSVVTVLADGSMGSGVVYTTDGLIVTNEHVVRGAKQVEVAFADGRRVPGTVQATDTITDLAVIQAKRSGVPAAEFRKTLPAVGELSVVLGSPLGFRNTATAGIVSGLQREIPGSARSTQSLVNLLQTDAPISPGNSGGPVVDSDGRVIGISEAYIPPQRGAVALGFAIPAPTVVEVVDELIRDGEATHTYVGLQPAPITPQIAEQLGLGSVRGVLVLDVVAGGPAQAAGLRPGDVVTAVSGEPTDRVEDFLAAIRPLSPGDAVTLTVVRDDTEHALRVVLGKRPQ
jgi:S1-C subfamily serine protease